MSCYYHGSVCDGSRCPPDEPTYRKPPYGSFVIDVQDHMFCTGITFFTATGRQIFYCEVGCDSDVSQVVEAFFNGMEIGWYAK